MSREFTNDIPSFRFWAHVHSKHDPAYSGNYEKSSEAQVCVSQTIVVDLALSKSEHRRNVLVIERRRCVRD